MSLRQVVQRGDMKDQRWRENLVEKLEELHLLCVQADAFLSAFEAIYNDTLWSIDGDPERRRALNRMSCFADGLNQKLDTLLRASQEAVELR